MTVEGDSMEPTLCDGYTVLVDMTRKAPTPWYLRPGLWNVACRQATSACTKQRLACRSRLSDNKHYPEYERTADEINIIGRIRWFAREI